MNKCSSVCEVFSRVTGYFRPVSNWNKGKKSEFHDRKVFNVAEPKDNSKNVKREAALPR